MYEIGSRRRSLPAPPGVVFDDLIAPNRHGSRTWLTLLDDEHEPQILESDGPERVAWSSIWRRRPDARIVFDLPPGRGGTDITWTLSVEDPLPDDSLTGHMCQRLNTLIHADLRSTYGQ